MRRAAYEYFGAAGTAAQGAAMVPPRSRSTVQATEYHQVSAFSIAKSAAGDVELTPVDQE